MKWIRQAVQSLGGWLLQIWTLAWKMRVCFVQDGACMRESSFCHTSLTRRIFRPTPKTFSRGDVVAVWFEDSGEGLSAWFLAEYLQGQPGGMAAVRFDGDNIQEVFQEHLTLVQKGIGHAG